MPAVAGMTREGKMQRIPEPELMEDMAQLKDAGLKLAVEEAGEIHILVYGTKT